MDFGMEQITQDETKKIAYYLYDKMRDYFGEKLRDDGFSYVPSMVDGENAFDIFLVMYDFFGISFHYDKNSIYFSIINGNYNIILPNSQKQWDPEKVNILLKALQQELELRIPDKFLKAHGWI